MGYSVTAKFVGLSRGRDEARDCATWTFLYFLELVGRVSNASTQFLITSRTDVGSCPRHVAKSMDSILHGLNDAQKAAVSSPASILQVLAPPGAGKTKTLTARVAYLISNGLAPGNVIVCTFTVKAAKEMRERLQDLLGAQVASRLILGTFHSVSRRFLLSHGHLIGLPAKFGIADASDSKSMISRIIMREKLSINSGQARGRISSLKANRISAEQNAATSKLNSNSLIDRQEFTRVYYEYEEQLKVSHLLDYDDLLLRCADLLRHFPGCVSSIQAVLIDEFQDTNNVQYDLMRLFAQSEHVISVVGDPDQSIYGWRSAKIENLRKMTMHYPDTHVATLEENYRSSGCILLAAQQVIEQDLERPQKSLAPTHSIGVPPTMRWLDTADTEAAWIVHEIQRVSVLTGGLVNWDDFAILLRSASLSRPIETKLGKAGIPHRIVGGHRFFDRFEVRLVLDYLRVLDHPGHTDALLRIINCPPRGIGNTTLMKLIEHSSERRLSLWDLVLKVSRGESGTFKDIGCQTQRGIDCFVNFIITQQKRLFEAPGITLACFVKRLVEKLQLQDFLKRKYPNKEDSDDRWANIQEVIGQAAQAESCDVDDSWLDDQGPTIEAQMSRNRVLSHFLANIALSTSTEEQCKDSPKRGQITLSTMHAAKGLEWPIVFIPSTYEGSIPHSRAENADEERRLLYVAMTRAQGILYLSCPLKTGMDNEMTLSHFLSPEDVLRQFTDFGPTLDLDLVRELAQILRRPCPTAQQIQANRSSSLSHRDNKFQKGASQEEGPESAQDIDPNVQCGTLYPPRTLSKHKLLDHSNAFSYKKQKVVTSITELQTSATMTQTADYSISKTRFKTGFVSATKVPRSGTEADSSSRVDLKICQSASTEVSSLQSHVRRNTKLLPGQTRLSGYFIRNRPSDSIVTGLSSEGCQKDHQLAPTTSSEDASSLVVRGVDSPDGLPGDNMAEVRIDAHETPKPFHSARGKIRKTLGMRRSMAGWDSRTNR